MIFSTFDAYEQFLYALPDRFASIQSSTLALIRHDKSVAVVRGEVWFAQHVRMIVREQLP